MAEAVGIVAATLQFASVGNTILSLILKLRGFSDKAKGLKSQVNQLLALIDAIQSRLPSEASSNMSQQLELAILDCAALGRQMIQLLEDVAVSPDDSIPGKKWKAILGVMKEKRFEEICDHLERHKTFLNLYISNTNSVLLEKLAEKLEEGRSARPGMEQDFLQHNIVRGDPTVATALSEFSHNASMENRQQDTQELPRAPEISLSSENLAAIAGVIDNAVKTRFLELQGNLHFQPSKQGSIPSGTGFSVSGECSDSLVTQVKLNSSTLDLGPAPTNESSPALWKPRPNLEVMGYRGHATCSCRPQTRKINWVSGLASLSLRVKVLVHHESCNTQTGYRSLSLQIQAFNNSVFKSAISLDRRCRPSLTQSLTIRPVVDFKLSPAFRLFLDDFSIYQVGKSLEWTSINDDMQYEAKVHRIQNRLLALIREGMVSPLELNQYGETLMSVALRFLEYPAVTICRYNPDIAKNLIRFLIALGVPLDDQSHESSSLWRIALLERNFKHSEGDISLISEYSDKWGETDDPHDFGFHGLTYVNEYVSPPSPVWYLNVLQCLPGISQVSTYSKMLAAISYRSLPSLRKLMENGANINEKGLWGQTALHMSAAWPDGLRILIRGGGNVDSLDHEGRTPICFAAGAQCLEAVELLLQENCELIIPARAFDPHVRFVLWDVLDTSEQIQSRIMSNLESRLSQLRDLDTRHLDAKDFRTLSHQTFGSYTLRILISLGFEELGKETNLKADIQEKGFSFAGHASLFYGGLRYLDFDVFAARIAFKDGFALQDAKERALSIIDKIYLAGFTNLDGYNNDGYTLLHICYLRGKLIGIQWLLQKLQVPPNNIRDSGANAMHCIAQYLGKYFEGYYLKYSGIEQILCLLKLQGVDPLAKCCSRCACLIDGNSPTATLTREVCQQKLQGIERRDLFKSILGVWSAAIDGCAITSEEVYRQMVLSETFTRLGLTHTCSNKACENLLSYSDRHLNHCCYVEPRDQEGIDDAIEIQDEEEELIQQLGFWMSQYETERAKFDGFVEQFFDIWWDRLPDHELDFFPSSVDESRIAWEVEIDSD